MGSLIEIYCSYELGDVLCAKSYLEAHGVSTIILNEHHGTMQSWIILALGGYRLVVHSEDAQDARALLQTVREESFSSAELDAAYSTVHFSEEPDALKE